MADTPPPPSALKPRPLPENYVLSDADTNRMRHAYQILADMVSSSKTDEKRELILWHTTKFAVDVSLRLGLSPPVAEDATPATPANPSTPVNRTQRSATESRRAADDNFIEPDDGPDAATIQGLRELGIGNNSDKVTLALGRARARVTPLTTITFGPYLDSSIDQIVAQRDAFIRELLLAEVPVMKNLVQETHTFAEDEAHKIANQIFNDLVGISAVKHIDILLREYKTKNAAGLDSSAGAKAEQLSVDARIPSSLRNFLAAFATYQKIQFRRSKPKWTALHETIVDLKLYRRITKLMNPTSSAERRALLDYFREGGYLPGGAGQRLKTGVKNFFLAELNMDDTALTWINDAIVPVGHMAEIFGNGILVFLDREHIRQIRAFGSAKMKFAFDLLDKHCPWIQELADMADEYILTPIIEGQTLEDLHFKTGSTLPWVSRFEFVEQDHAMQG